MKINRKHALGSQVFADLRQGIVTGGVRYLAAVIVGFIYADLYFRSMDGAISSGRVTGGMSFAECVTYVFRGMREFVPSQRNTFEIPVQFLIMVLILATYVGNYPMKDLQGFGKQLLIKSSTRAFWWISKCIWNAAIVFVYYISIYAGIIVACILHSGQLESIWGLKLDHLSLILSDNGRGQMNTAMLLTMVLILPIVTSLALSAFQMAAALIFHPVIGYMAIIVIAVFSAYYTVWFLPGNFLMTYRYDQVCAHGVRLSTSLAVDLVILVISWIAGYVYFRKSDIL